MSLRRFLLKVVLGVVLGAVSRLALVIPMLFILSTTGFPADEQWKGIDDTVINKYAAEQGREAKAPLINTDKGDLLLFVFLLAGAVGGFAAGYYWKTLISGGDQKQGPSDDARKAG